MCFAYAFVWGVQDGLATPVDGLALFSLAEPHTPDTPASVSSAPPATLQWGQVILIEAGSISKFCLVYAVIFMRSLA
eukprot:389142-Rhodomonas_salina.1